MRILHAAVHLVESLALSSMAAISSGGRLAAERDTAEPWRNQAVRGLIWLRTFITHHASSPRFSSVSNFASRRWKWKIYTYQSKEKKKTLILWNVDTLRRASLYTHRMPNQHPLREFWLIKQALCAGINNAEAMWEPWWAQRPAISLMHH